MSRLLGPILFSFITPNSPLSVQPLPLATNTLATTHAPTPTMSNMAQQAQQTQAPVAEVPNPTNGSSGRDSSASSLLEPKTYLDPNADVVLRSNDGRDFRVFSHTLKANSDKFVQMLANQSGETTINVNADRKPLKLLLDIMTLVPMPGVYVWSMRDRIFPLVEEYECKFALERMLAMCVECPERDPWGMFVVASKNNYLPLARVALFELGREDMINDMGHDMGTAMNGMNQFGGSPMMGYGQFHGQALSQFSSPSMPSSPESAMSMLSKRSSKAIPAPPLRNLTSANLEGVSAPFMLGLLNAVMEAATDGVPLTWYHVAARFNPAGDERPMTKKERKMMAMGGMGGNQQQHQQFNNMNARSNMQSPSGHAQGGAGLGLHFNPIQQFQHHQPFFGGNGKGMPHKQMSPGKKILA